MNARLAASLSAAFTLAIFAALLLATTLIGDSGIRPDFGARNLAPSWAHPFGTDPMGRDMLARTLHALTLSAQIGLLASGLSVIMATAIALASGLGPRIDAAMRFLTDTMLALPHLLLLILLSFALGGGTSAVIIAVAISHWPRLSRILRAELHQSLTAPYIETARALGRSRAYQLSHHLLPHLIPQMLVGFVLTFPHAILHEAGLTFLGFGLEPSRPAIGVMLHEAMRHLSAGRWWLGVGPGLMLLMLVLSVEQLSTALHRLHTPKAV